MKRLINIVILFAFIVNPIMVQYNALQASGFGESTSYGNYGAGYVGKVYDDGNSIGYSVGGKYTLKLNKRTPTVWFNGKTPSIAAGCGGISFSGGFMSLLNLDQIGEQLKDAGAAFAWGIMLGLVTSLPSIKEVWDTINKWARMIQNLLANACNAGKKIGKMAQSKIVSDGVDGAFDKVVDTVSGDDSLISSLQKAGSDPVKHITDWLHGANEWATSPATPSEKNAAAANILKNIFIHNAVGSKTLSSAKREFGLETFDLVDRNWDALANKSGDILEDTFLKSDPKNLSGSKLVDYQLKVIVGVFLYNSISSTVVTSKAQETIKGLMSDIKKVIEDGGDPKKLEKVLNTFNEAFEKPGSVYTSYTPTQTTSDVAATIRMWAENGLSDPEAVHMKNFELPLVKGFVVAPSNTSGSINENSIVLYDVATSGVNQGAPVTLEGTGWEQALNKFGNFSKLAEKQIDCLRRDSAVNGCEDTLPVLIPKVKEYMYIYSQSLEEDQLMASAKLQIEIEDALWSTLRTYMKHECMRLNSLSEASVNAKDGGELKAIGSGFNQESIENDKNNCEKLWRSLENVKPKDENDESLTVIMSGLKVKNIQRGLANAKR